MNTEDHVTPADGEVLTAISDGVVRLLKEYYGRGPTHTRTYYQDDLVVCVMRGGFTAVEQTLLDAGYASSVRMQRIEFQEVMRERFTTIIERATGRRVIGFMSGQQHDPPMISKLFVLASASGKRRGHGNRYLTTTSSD